MTPEEIKPVVKDYILEQFLPGEDPSALTDDTRLVSEGILDSLASLKLVAHLEETYKITIDAHEVSADYLDTLDAITKMIIEKRG